MAVVQFRVREPSLSPVQNVNVRVYAAVGGALIAEGFSNVDGILDLILANGDYLVRAKYDAEAYSIVSPQALTVTGDVNVVLTITILDKPVATHPRLCRVYGYLKTPHGLPHPHALTLAFRDPYIYADELFIGFTGELDPDDDGYVEVDLVRGRSYTAIYGVFGDEDVLIYIPDRSSALLSDVLYPYVSAVAPDTKAMLVGDTLSFADMTFTLSNGEEGDHDDLTFESDDVSVVDVVGSTLEAIGAGAATVSVTYEDDYRDAVVVDTIAVTVA